MQPDTLLNSSRHLVGQLRQSRGTLRAWWRQQMKRKRASVVANNVCQTGLSWLIHINLIHCFSLLSWFYLGFISQFSVFIPASITSYVCLYKSLISLTLVSPFLTLYFDGCKRREHKWVLSFINHLFIMKCTVSPLLLPLSWSQSHLVTCHSHWWDVCR